MNSEQRLTIVVVGGVAGGASAAARGRRCNESARIVLFEKDAHVSFANCGLPYYLGGEIQDRNKLVVTTPAQLRDRFNIEVHTRHEVVALDRKGKTVRVRNRDTGAEMTQGYDKLILAPGAEPFVPQAPGHDARNVFSLRNLEDTDRIAEWISQESPKHALVVGAGFIGLEMVEQFHRRGLEVGLVELLDQVLPPLDAEMAGPLVEAMEAKGVAVYLGCSVAEYRSTDGLVTAAVLSDGREVPADIVLVGTGVRPAVKLATEAGLALGAMGGIAVNEYMQTSDPDVYAAGDAVEYPHAVTGAAMRVALAGPANRGGRLAGEHAATGTARAMTPVAGTAIVRVFEKSAGITGLSVKAAQKLNIAARAVIITANHHAGYYPGAQPMQLKLVYSPEDGRVLGAQAVGGAGVDKRLDVIATAIHFRGTVHDLAGVDLAYAPPFGSAKDPVHIAAFTAINDLEGFAEVAAPDTDLRGKQVVDVRTAAEAAKGTLPGAIHIPVDALRERAGTLDAHAPTIVVCQSGLRAHTALRILKQSGFEDVKNLTGGMTMQKYVRREAREK